MHVNEKLLSQNKKGQVYTCSQENIILKLSEVKLAIATGRFRNRSLRTTQQELFLSSLVLKGKGKRKERGNEKKKGRGKGVK